MGGGHGHGGHGHGAHDGHGGGGAHGGDAHGGDHGPAEIPAAPATREISPAREDYAQPWPGRLLLWPAVWLVVAVVFFWLAKHQPGTVVRDHRDAGHGAPAGH